MFALEIDELVMAKVAYLNGYQDVFHNEDPSKGEITLPDEWIMDSDKIIEFAIDHDIKREDTGYGDIYYFTEEQEETFRSNLSDAVTKTVNELLLQTIAV
ncbi:hypothetical protein IMZ31_23875 (plasmid) [Pontibacillus sp. ALD_SL1]|uniref:hypothetical protein n=1 Tax=Pontibacillus sp. ALD_SL1 TaxID=2777185 RepID=UPI001A960FBC|nr:hypothetical protein [Pontibacillus sp. ALD_SL1]QST02492.1 hypothetical protein IMZ31_23875 [Pontibacillus sp. ALD_SL1]